MASSHRLASHAGAGPPGSPLASTRPLNVLLVAWKCDASRGSEYLGGWGWATAYADAGHHVWVACGPDGEPGKITLERRSGGSCTFLRMGYPIWISRASVSVRYAYRQWAALRQSCSLQRRIPFDLVHHVGMASVQAGSTLCRLGVPFVFGPVGGGQHANAAFSRYFGRSWWKERLRSLLLCRFSAWLPSARATLRRAVLVLAANPDTARLATALGARHVRLESDAVIPTDFFPAHQPQPKGTSARLRLLWVGRSFPRKGLLLALEGLSQVPPRVAWHLTLVGGGPLASAIPGWLERLGLVDRVTIRGQIPLAAVREEYGRSDLFLFTSLRDSGPSQLLEAMAFALLRGDPRAARSGLPGAAGPRHPRAGARSGQHHRRDLPRHHHPAR